ncbi:hypothetical protein L204_102653 [Cryptococcus depauperatus]|nr:hypothetical protein L204_00597 [Cryptococcus depauperatus CBS 7855]
MLSSNYSWKRPTSPTSILGEVPPPARSNRSSSLSSGSLSVPSSLTPPPSSSSSSTLPRPQKLRSRTSTMTTVYPSPLLPVMSRENSAENMQSMSTVQIPCIRTEMDSKVEANVAGSSRKTAGKLCPLSHHGRRASKSVSAVGPTVIVTPSQQAHYTPQTHTMPIFISSPNSGGSGQMSSPEADSKNGLKRRTSTPSLYRRFNKDEGEEDSRDEEYAKQEQMKQEKQGRLEVRARSTSTSVVNPESRDLTENSVYTLPVQIHDVPTMSPDVGMQQAPPSRSPVPSPPTARQGESSQLGAVGLLTSAYNATESSFSHLLGYVRPPSFSHRSYDRIEASEDDSEKDINGSEDETLESENTCLSDESITRGRCWLGGGDEAEAEGVHYFSLPPTPTESLGHSSFSAALSYGDSLPTPALSTNSLSRGDSKRQKLRKALRRISRQSSSDGDSQNGWWATVWSRGQSGGNGKVGEVLKDLGWTVGALAICFVVSLGLVLWLIRGMPITTLKHLPQSTTDVQLLSAEIRAYMAASTYGWWHTVVVLTFVGCWKHAWSVPGAVVLNILTGSLLEPIPALSLLTIITASGSLGAYLLSRPLAPLIAILFPKPLAFVRAALTPESVLLSESSLATPAETITPIQTSVNPSVQPIGDAEAASAIWRRLLIMRAMGFVPWSGMNVACGVVGVDWRIFWLTTAVGSASWSYVTASVGNILARLKVPNSAMSAAQSSIEGESLTSLLRDPVLIFKLAFLSALTLLPVIFKRRTSNDTASFTSQSSSYSLLELPTPSGSSFPSLLYPPLNPRITSLHLSGSDNAPMSLSQSLAKFTPTPRVFDLLSFGRIAIRQSGRAVAGGVRSVVNGARGVVRGVAQT